MSLLLGCQGVAKAWDSRALFDNLCFGIFEGDRIGLVGPNGSGKSTLLQILAGIVPPDSGVVAPRKLLRIGYVEQESAFPPEATIGDLVRAVPLADHLDETEHSARISQTLGRAGFASAGVRTGTLSGGWKKRLAIALELVKQPGLLLLDEPTNHLDLEGILWLEKMLRSAEFASLTISHDRYFLENTATVMMELDRVYPDGLLRAAGNYSEFLVKKEEFLEAQARRQEALENKVRREIEWLRRGAKARTTKSKARIDAAGRLIDELGDLNARSAARTAQIDFTGTDRRTKRLIEARHVTKALGGRALFRDLSFVLSPGARLGLLGPNGSGKTTLLQLLTGEREPDTGEVARAENVRMVYFDQARENLDPAVTLRRALAPEGDSVMYRGRPIHVAGWASRFLFRNEQLELPVGRLSGGEQARVLIARMMLEPADVLLLDEPTNNLDIPTLEVLEDSLLDFPGAIALVTHDRYLLDRVSTTIVGLDGAGGAALYAECAQWEQEMAGVRRREREPAPSAGKPAAQGSPPKKKLSYHESREWEQMEERILEAEERLRRAHEEMQNPEGSADASIVTSRYEALQAAQLRVDRLYERWAELESRLTG
jgi:ATP-binding cassette subfamily F protein uup